MWTGLAPSSDSKESAGSAGDAKDTVSIPGLGRFPGELLPTPGFLSGEFHGQRSLVGYSPMGRNESDMTEGLTLSLSLGIKNEKPSQVQDVQSCGTGCVH